MMRLGIWQTAVVVILLLGASGCGSGGGGSGDQGALYPGGEFPVGRNPYGLAAADVDSDGNADLIAASRQDQAITILMGNGDGTFQPGVPFPMGASPADVVAADINGDGNPDVISVDLDLSYTINAILGAGDGTFGAPQASAILIQPWFGLVAADVNGDDLPDVIMPHTAQFFGQLASVFLSNGDGTFAETPRDFTHSSGFQSEVEVADLNGDDVPDLLVNVLLQSVFLYFGNGDGTFLTQVPLSIPGFPFVTVLVDVNNDGNVDIVARGADNFIRVLLGIGNGTFDAPIVLQSAYNLSDMETAFLNDDEYPDLVLHGADFLGVLLGQGDGTFEDAGLYMVGSTFEVAFADFDNDGDTDLGLTDGPSGAVRIVLGHGDGTLDARRFIPVDEDSDLRDVKLGDFDGDGQLDLVAFQWSEDGVQFWRGDGEGSFDFISASPVSREPEALLTGDLNNDEVPDLVGVSRLGIHAYLSDGTGSFELAHGLETDETEDMAALGFLNGDGILDIAFPSDVAVYVLLGVGDGTFADPVVHAAQTDNGEIAMADFDEDGDTDVVIVTDEQLHLMLGNGDGSLQAQQPILDLERRAEHLCTDDVNRDGLPDLVYASDDDVLSVALNLGGGTFAHTGDYQTPYFVIHAALADLNGDKRPDIAAKSDFDEVFILLGNGDGTFQDLQTFRLGESETFDIGDVNGDTEPDFVAFHENNDGEGIAVLLHR